MTRPERLIPYTKHVLPNGLQLLLHEDHADPVVSVYVYYHVGSSREARGKSGFAHLFEHMLFQGSANVGDNDHFRFVTEAGGTLNGTTSQDRTNYFESLPSSRLELALWLESDRMGFLLPAMTQDKLDNQRDVVRNERRQSYENRPYGLVHETVLRHLYPPGHPYSWSTIGSMADLAEATLGDIEHFFRTFYGPNNATLAIGGDFDPERALELVTRYFGPIPSGPPVPEPRPEPTTLAASHYIHLEDHIQRPQLTLVWPTVEARHADEIALDLLADVLSANKSSILDKALMVDEELASYVTIYHHGAERAGSLMVNLRPFPEVSLATLEERVDQLVHQVVEQGVDPARVERLKVRREGMLLRGLETVAGRTSRIGIDNCLGNDPDRIDAYLEDLRALDAARLREAAARYLDGRPRIALSVVPHGKLELAVPGSVPAGEAAADASGEHFPLNESHIAAAVAGDGATLDRSRAPGPAPEGEFRSPSVWRGVLANRIAVAGTSGSRIPIARTTLALPGGRLAEDEDSLGLAELTARMLKEGTARCSGTEFLDEVDGIGGNFEVSAHDDEFVLLFSALSEHFSSAVGLLSEAVLTPRFAPEDFERVRRQQLVDLDARLEQPGAIAQDVFRHLIHGDGVRGASAFGTRASLERLTLADVKRFWAERAFPHAARIAYVGEADANELTSDFTALAAGAAHPAAFERGLDAVRRTSAELVPAQRGPGVIYLVDKPGAEQSELRLGHRGIARTDPDWFASFTMNFVLGGSFSSRINLNLREDKGYTYGARSGFSGALTPGTFVISTAVQTGVTAPAIREIRTEVERFVAEGVSATEVDFVRQSVTQSLRRNFESARTRLAFLEAIGKYGWPDDYPARRIAYLAELDEAEMNRTAKQHVRPDELCVLVVGDRSRIESELAELGEVTLLDSRGARCELTV